MKNIEYDDNDDEYKEQISRATIHKRKKRWPIIFSILLVTQTLNHFSLYFRTKFDT